MNNEEQKPHQQPEHQQPPQDSEAVEVLRVQIGTPVDPKDGDAINRLLEQFPTGLKFDRRVDPETSEEEVVVSITEEGLSNLTPAERRKLGL